MLTIQAQTKILTIQNLTALGFQLLSAVILLRKMCTFQRRNIPAKLILYLWQRMISEKQFLGGPRKIMAKGHRERWMRSSSQIIESKSNQGLSPTSRAGCFHKICLQKFQNYYRSRIAAISHSSPFLIVVLILALPPLFYHCVLWWVSGKLKGRTKITSQVSGPRGAISRPDGEITGHRDHRTYEDSYCYLGSNMLSKNNIILWMSFYYSKEYFLDSKMHTFLYSNISKIEYILKSRLKSLPTPK